MAKRMKYQSKTGMQALYLALLIFFSSTVAWGQQDFSTDKKMGAQAAQQVEQMMGIYPDEELNEYVSQVGNRLAKSLGTLPFEFQFRVVDMAEPNAFALPGGYVYVSRGILSLMNSEDELAGVIGHEMIHVTKRHSIKQMRQGILPGILRIPGAVVGVFNSDLGKIINAPVNFGSALFLSSYSRRQEREADELGIKLSAQAGYDPTSLSGVLDHLAADMENMSGEEEKRSYFSSHPYTPKRVDDINEKAPALSWSPQPPLADKGALYHKLDGMVLGPDPAQGIIEEDVFRHYDLDFAFELPGGWETMNVPVAFLATEPKGNAQLYLGGDNPKYKPDSLGGLIANMLREQYKINPYRNEKLNINGFDAYVVAFKDESGSQPVDIQIYYVHTGEILLNVMGMAYNAYADTISGSALSLRPLTEAERSEYTAVRLRAVEAEAGESLQEYSDRTGNTWDLKTTALMNSREENTVLQAGEILKIAREEPYQ